MKVHQFVFLTASVIMFGSTVIAQQTPVQTQPSRVVPNQTQQNQTQQNQIQPGQAQSTQGQAIQRQQGQGQSSQTSTGQSMQGGKSQSKDQALATCLAIDNQSEVLISQFAKEKAKSEEVKKFAAMLEEEHQAAVQKLKAISPQGTNTSTAGFTTPASGSNTQQAGTTSAPNISTVSNPTSIASNASQVDFVQLHREMADQCLADSKKELNEKEGAEFDKCFVGMQIANHAAMHSKLTVLQRHATGQLKDVISECLETTDKHKEKAVKIMEDLAEDDSSRSDRKKEK